MFHSFDTEIAEEYGIAEAILINNIAFWVAHNKANDTNFNDGDYWTYNSVKAFCELFPYLTKKKIENALKKLIDSDLIKKGNYNKSAYDRTCWYALTEKGKITVNKLENAVPEKDNSIYPKREMNLPKKGNQNTQKGEPIPDINTDIKTTDNKTYTYTVATATGSEPTRTNKTYNYEEVRQLYEEKCKSFNGIRTLSDDRKRKLKTLLNNYDLSDIEQVFEKAEQSEFLKGKNSSGWTATFDWLIKSANFLKVLEGNYDNKGTKPNEELDEWDILERDGYDWNSYVPPHLREGQ